MLRHSQGVEPGTRVVNLPQRSALAKHWSLDENTVFLNHGSFGACPDFVIQKQIEIQQELEKDPVNFMDQILPLESEKVRKKLGEFLCCSADDIALISNATSGVNTVLRSLSFAEGDQILVPDHAYQACRNAIDFVAAKYRVEVVTCQIPFPVESKEQVIELILNSSTPKTKLAMIDTVTSPTGLRMPFEEITRELESRGINVLLDAAHGPGIVPLNLERLGASFVTGNCHKWLCSAKGSAFLYVRHDLQETIRPLTISHGMTFPTIEKTKFRNEFDWLGTVDPSPWLTIPVAIDGLANLVSQGWDGIMRSNNRLVIQARDLLCDRLGIEQPCPDDMISALSTIRLPGDAKPPYHLMDPLMQQLYHEYSIQVPVWGWPSPNGRYIRISAQIYNHIDQYQYLADCLEKVV